MNNNGVFMGYIDPDGTGGVFNGSSATLALPAVATIRFAGLYWGADTSSATGGQLPRGWSPYARDSRPDSDSA